VTAESVERRLAAVLAADVAGYSRLMGLDEEGTLARLKAVRKALIDPTIAEHRGRIVKTTGDGMLTEFASAVDAVRGAVEVQRVMAERNASVPQDERIELRIGIHVGDIIFDDSDIFGDGVSRPGSKVSRTPAAFVSPTMRIGKFAARSISCSMIWGRRP